MRERIKGIQREKGKWKEGGQVETMDNKDGRKTGRKEKMKGMNK